MGPTYLNWAACMQKTSCKWAAIISTIVGVLIVLLLIYCALRGCCCGLSCCCRCFSCFERCRPSGRGRKRSRYVDPPAGYRQHNPDMGHGPPAYQGLPPYQGPPAYQGPNTATFDASGRELNGDSLPAMPTWADAHVEDSNHCGDVEMGRISQPGQTAEVLPLATGRTSRGEYHELPGHHGLNEPPRIYGGPHSAHPYGSDIGAQSMTAQNTAYDPPQPRPQPDRFQSSAAAPAPYSRSSPPQPGYTPYSPDLEGSSPARPPSLLQIGRKPVNGSSREI